MPEWFVGKIPTSIERPCLSLGVEGFAGPMASGPVPVVDHGCNVQISVLRSGEEEGLDCNCKSFSEVFSTIAGDLCVVYVFCGVLCNNLYLHC